MICILRLAHQLNCAYEYEKLVSEPLSSPMKVKDYVRRKLGCQEVECFHVLFLDTQNKIIDSQQFGMGGVSQNAIPLNEVIREAIILRASALICVHNHPSGKVDPSIEDINITQKLENMLEVMDVRLHDHLIASPTEVYSIKMKACV